MDPELPTITATADSDTLAPFAGWLATLANPKTRRSYAHAVGRFLAYARTTYLACVPDELTDGMLAAWADHLSHTGNMVAATIRRRQSAVRGALRWVRQTGEAARLVQVEREQRACIALLQAQLVAYQAALAGLSTAIQHSAPGAVVCGCSFVEECHRVDCPLQQAARLLAMAA